MVHKQSKSKLTRLHPCPGGCQVQAEGVLFPIQVPCSSYFPFQSKGQLCPSQFTCCHCGRYPCQLVSASWSSYCLQHFAACFKGIYLTCC